MAALGKVGADVSENVKGISDLKDISKKMADGTADEKEIKDFGAVSDAMKNTSLEDVKNTLEENVKPIPNDNLHNKLAELQQKTADPEFQKLPVEVQSGIMRDIEDTQNEIALKTKSEIESHIDQAHNEGQIKELDDKISQVESSIEGQPEAVKESIQNTLNDLKQQRNALQESSTSSVLQHSQEPTGETGRGRERMEPGQQGNETSQESKTENGIPEEKTLKEVVDKPILYNGEKATLYKDGQVLVAAIDGTNKEYEIGNADQLANDPIKDHNIEAIPEPVLPKSVVTVDQEGDINVRDSKYKNNYSDPLAAINKDSDGNIISVTLETPEGKKRTFRGDVADDIAYQIHLKELNKDDETRQQFEDFVQSNDEIKQQLSDGAIDETPEAEAVENNDEVPGEQTKSENVTPENKKEKKVPDKKTEEATKLVKITHAAIEADRAKLGLPPIEKEASDAEKDFNEAHATFREEPALAQKLIDLQRPATRKEVYQLALQKADLLAQSKVLREQIIKSPEHAEELKVKLRLAEEAADVNDRALKNVSSEAGKALQAMQAAIAEDMSLENTLLTARSYSKDGKITPEQEKTFTEITNKLAALEKEFADYKEKKSKKDAQKTIDNIVSEPKEKKTVFNRTKEERLSKIAELKDKWKGLNNDKSGPVKQGLAISDEHIKIIAQLAAEYIGLGVTEFKALAKKIKNDLGEISDEDFKKIFDTESVDGKTLSDFATETEKNKNVKISETEEGKIKNLRAKLRNLVSKGITDIDDIVKELKKELPEMTEREIRDEISGYGKTSELSTEPIDKKIREVKRVGSLISALEDVQKGQSPKRTGLKRDELTDQEKKLRSEINQAMRENQKGIESGEMTSDQWKTALDKYKKRLTNKYNELLEQKKNHDYKVKKKHALELDAEALELKKKIDKEKGNRKRELEKIRLENRGKFEKTADNIIKWMRFGILASAYKAILKLGIAGAAKGYIQNPVNTLIAGIYSKIPGIREVYNQSPRWRSKGSTKALAHGIAEAWSKKTWNDVKAQLKGGKRSDEIQFGNDKGHLPPGLAELWNVEHKILKTPLMNAEFRTSMEKNLQFLADQGKNIADPTVINIASARATEDAARAVYMAKNKVVSSYHAALKILAAETKDGSTGGKIIGKILEGENLIVKVPTNFIQEQLESTPIGAIQFLHGIRKGVNDLPPDVADRLARKLNNATAGTIALTIGGLLYLNHFGGNKYIRQSNNRAAKEEDGMSEEEMNIMGINVPPYMQHFNFAQQLQMGAGIARIMDYYNQVDEKHKEEQENHFTKAAWEAMGSTISKIPFIESAKKDTEALKDSDGMEKLMGNLIDIFMALPGDAAKVIDSEDKRVAKTPLEHIESNIPGLRQMLPSKADEDSKAKLAKLFKKFRSGR